MTERYYPNRDEAPYGVARLGDEYNLIDIFDKFPKREKNLLNYYSIIGLAPLGIMTLAARYNMGMNKQWYFRPHYTLAAGAIAAALCYCGLEFREKWQIRTEAVCRDYIRLHPERFPPIKRKKFGDCLHDWHADRWYSNPEK